MQKYTEFEDDDFDDDQLEPVISKSQKKREMHQLLQLTEKALSLSDDKLAGTGLGDKALQAIREARKMKASGARNRQLKYITKLIKQEDVQVLEDYLRETEDAHLLENKRFHQLEKWRDRLVTEGDTVMGELLQEYPHADRQQLRTLIRQAQKEAEQNKAPSASRKLFKYLRTISA
jgi:ribosome-associated protein